MNNCTLGVIGHGYVGESQSFAFSPSFDVRVYDKDSLKSTHSLDEVLESNFVFVCVPTPMKKDGNQDLRILFNVLEDISKSSINALVVIKSTILPIHLQDLFKIYSKIVINPEFLTERNATEDFINSKLIIFGGTSSLCDEISNFYRNHTACIESVHHFTDPITACFVKYSINSFLASKVIFFNELKVLFDKSSSKDSWKKFTNLLSIDERIGSTHMSVPGHDNRLGFGGACFPKDTNAFIKYSEEVNAKLNLLDEVVRINNKIRSSYKNQTNREQDQNISFDIEEIN